MVCRPEVTGRRPAAALEPGDFDAYSVEEFCRRHSISTALFYKLDQQGKAPATFYAGVRRLVSKEAAARWRSECETAGADT